MAKSENQKLKLLKIIEILENKTDEDHPITIEQLEKELEEFGIKAERKSLYSDLNLLIDDGMDIVRDGKRNYLASRKYELAELKMLSDAVASSKFISVKKTEELLKKLEGEASVYQAKELKRDLRFLDRVKTENAKIYYNLDSIYQAIAGNNKVMFEYFDYGLNKILSVKKSDKPVVVSPLKLIYDNDNYYLVAKVEAKAEGDNERHYRVDKMKNVTVLEEKGDRSKDFDPVKFTKATFGMFGGELKKVKLIADNSMIGTVIDRFGKDIPVKKESDDKFSTRVDVHVSQQFYGWITGLGGKVLIDGPEDVKGAYAAYLKGLLDNYKKS
ncbi:MAG: WYL domain-containing protein [Lachnospiraceae bacterium]|nr:WYL domain-containing protein [Lachnospiraceae bacterium]